MTLNPLLTSPAPGFDDPLGVLAACHFRIQAQCATLSKLAAHLPVHGSDEQARQAARNILRYFDSAGRHHHEDEEQDLFPLLGEVALIKGETQLIAVIDQLTAEHRSMEQQWLVLRPLLAAIEAGQPVALSGEAVQGFVTLYQTHIAMEENSLLPRAAELLGPAQIERLGGWMARRRNISIG